MPTLDWDKGKCVSSCQPEQLRANISHKSKIKKLEREDVIDDDIIEAYEAMAKIVTNHGEKYLPIFERIYSEIQITEAKRKLLEVAKDVSKKYLSTDLTL